MQHFQFLDRVCQEWQLRGSCQLAHVLPYTFVPKAWGYRSKSASTIALHPFALRCVATIWECLFSVWELPLFHLLLMQCRPGYRWGSWWSSRRTRPGVADDLVDALLQDAENGAAFLAKLKWISLKLYNWNMSWSYYSFRYIYFVLNLGCHGAWGATFSWGHCKKKQEARLGGPTACTNLSSIVVQKTFGTLDRCSWHQYQQDSPLSANKVGEDWKECSPGFPQVYLSRWEDLSSIH